MQMENLLSIIVEKYDIQLTFAKTRMGTKTLSRIPKSNIIKKDTRYNKATSRPLQHRDLMDVSLTIKILDIEQVNVDPRPKMHLISQAMHLEKVIL